MTFSIYRNPITYRCDAGHEFVSFTGDPTIAVVPRVGAEQQKYYFCMQCWGEWAVKQWPMREVDSGEG